MLIDGFPKESEALVARRRVLTPEAHPHLLPGTTKMPRRKRTFCPETSRRQGLRKVRFHDPRPAPCTKGNELAGEAKGDSVTAAEVTLSLFPYPAGTARQAKKVPDTWYVGFIEKELLLDCRP
jgi:hypothetical protein